MAKKSPLAFRGEKQHQEAFPSLLALEKSRKKEKKRDLVKERKIIGLVFGLTVGMSLFFLVLTQIQKKGVSWQKSSPSPIKGEKMPQKHYHWLSFFSFSRKKKPEELSLLLEEFLSGREKNWAIWVEEMEGDFVWKHQENEPFLAASLIKLPVVATLYSLVEERKYRLDEKVVLKKEDITGGAGSLASQPIGTKISLQKLAFLSLNQSDNTAFTILCRVLGRETIEEKIRQWGMTHTSLADNMTTAADMALFFRRLYRGEIITKKEHQAQFWEALTKTAFENRIPKGVPEGIKVSHKVGTEQGVVNDAGVIFVPGQPILLVFLSRHTSLPAGEALIRGMTEKIYWFLVTD
ncbi:serine hydrolase [bacterium]|nr:serine hydrolase [bacterium]